MLAYFSTTIHIVGSEINFVVSYSFETAFLSAHRCKKHHEFTYKNILCWTGSCTIKIKYISSAFTLDESTGEHCMPYLHKGTLANTEEFYRWTSSQTFLSSSAKGVFTTRPSGHREAKSSNRNKTHMHFSHTQRSQAYLADGEPSLRRWVCRLKAEQADCRAKQVADSNANHMSTYPGGSQARKRVSSPPSLTVLQTVWLRAQACLAVTYTVITTVSQLFYIQSESLTKNPHGQMEAFKSSFNCVVIMRLWGSQLGLIPVTSCGSNITGEGMEEWSDRQVSVLDSTPVGKNRRMCNRAARVVCKGCFFIPVEALLV